MHAYYILKHCSQQLYRGRDGKAVDHIHLAWPYDTAALAAVARLEDYEFELEFPDEDLGIDAGDLIIMAVEVDTSSWV